MSLNPVGDDVLVVSLTFCWFFFLDFVLTHSIYLVISPGIGQHVIMLLIKVLSHAGHGNV